MNRREFVALGAAALGAGCAFRAMDSAGTVVPLSSVRRLLVERVDATLGKCRYIADLGGRRVHQPTLIARPGEAFDAIIENRLPQPTTVHFHGLTLPEAADGAGFDPIPPGGTKPVHFEVRNRSGLYWFHPHAHGFTAEQVHAGLVGLLVVTDDDDDALDAGLALAAGNRLALAISDARVSNGTELPYAPTAEDCLHGWFGNRARVNGALEARYKVMPGWVRLQLLNACNARGLLLGFRDGESTLPFHLLGTDGGLLAAPRELERVFVYSAERVDIAINVAAGRAITAVSFEFDPRHHHAQGGGTVHRHADRKGHPRLAAVEICNASGKQDARDWLPDGAELPLFAINVRTEAAGTPPALPARLSALAEPAAAPLEGQTRRMRLDFDAQRGFLIDQTPYRAEETAFTVRRGAREVWEIKNSPISMPHPMHLHGFGFRVLRRQGTFGPARALAQADGGRLPTDLGIKDTVVVWPNETVWLGVDFALPDNLAFRGSQRYMLHCHNLEHEDGMMMRNFAVI